MLSGSIGRGLCSSGFDDWDWLEETIESEPDAEARAAESEADAELDAWSPVDSPLPLPLPLSGDDPCDRSSSAWCVAEEADPSGTNWGDVAVPLLPLLGALWRALGRRRQSRIRVAAIGAVADVVAGEVETAGPPKPDGRAAFLAGSQPTLPLELELLAVQSEMSPWSKPRGKCGRG